MLEQAENKNTIKWQEYVADENQQLLIGLDPDDTEKWMMCDSWDTDTACQLIIFGRKLDIEFERESMGDGIDPSPTQARAYEICCAYDHATTLANSAINAGLLKAHDSLAHWLQWAASKGYAVNHLLDDIEDPDGIVNHKLIEKRRELTDLMLKSETICETEVVDETKATNIVVIDTNIQKHHKLNRNELDPAIDEAIKLAGNMHLADVYLKLKELSIAEFNPFVGVNEESGLTYKNSDDKVKHLTKNALGKRLKLRKNQAV